MKELILSGDHNALINYRSQGKAFDLSIPTPEHFLPLLYTLGLKEEKEQNFNYGHGTGPGHPYPCSLGSRLII
jgi:aromatic ring-opening dioxygenase catalytic subunit (LigB family)